MPCIIHKMVSVPPMPTVFLLLIFTRHCGLEGTRLYWSDKGVSRKHGGKQLNFTLISTSISIF